MPLSTIIINLIIFKMKEVMYLCMQEHKFIVTLVSILYLVVTLTVIPICV